MANPFELFLFTTDAALIVSAVAAKIDGIVVDWESHGKSSRQAGFDTQINSDSLVDLERSRKYCAKKLICRVNSNYSGREQEIEKAVSAGADEILLPMLRKPEEAEAALAQVRGRAGVGILLETEEAIGLAQDFARLPLSRVYVGLNDLAIEQRRSNIFEFLLGDRLEKIRRWFNCPFGFGGLTLPELGSPLPCRLLIAELARLNCGFSFLRRSFLKDTQGKNLSRSVFQMRSALAASFSRTSETVSLERHELEAAIAGLKFGASDEPRAFPK